MAEWHGVDLGQEVESARGVSSMRQEQTATAKQRAAAAAVVKHNDQTDVENWSAPDPDGAVNADGTAVMRSRDWWTQRAEMRGFLPPQPAAPKTPDTDYARFLARFAQGRGKKAEDLTIEEELEARGQFGRSDDAPPRPVRPPRPPARVGQADRNEQRRQLRGQLRFLLRDPSRGTAEEIRTLQSRMQAAGMDVDVEKDTAARDVEAEGVRRGRARRLADPDGTGEFATADQLLKDFDAALGGGAEAPAPAPAPRPAPAAPRGRGVGPGPARGGSASAPGAGRTATRQQVEAVASRAGITYEEAKRRLEAEGVSVQ